MKSVYQFWMVWSPQGSAPTVRHLNPDSALAEAKRLAMTHRGREFYVLHSVKGYVMPAPGPEEIEITDDIPF